MSQARSYRDKLYEDLVQATTLEEFKNALKACEAKSNKSEVVPAKEAVDEYSQGEPQYTKYTYYYFVNPIQMYEYYANLIVKASSEKGENQAEEEKKITLFKAFFQKLELEAMNIERAQNAVIDKFSIRDANQEALKRLVEAIPKQENEKQIKAVVDFCKKNDDLSIPHNPHIVKFLLEKENQQIITDENKKNTIILNALKEDLTKTAMSYREKNKGVLWGYFGNPKHAGSTKKANAFIKDIEKAKSGDDIKKIIRKYNDKGFTERSLNTMLLRTITEYPALYQRGNIITEKSATMPEKIEKKDIQEAFERIGLGKDTFSLELKKP